MIAFPIPLHHQLVTLLLLLLQQLPLLPLANCLVGNSLLSLSSSSFFLSSSSSSLTIQRIYRSGGSRPCRSSDSTFGDNLNYTMSHSDKDSNNNINDRVRLLGVCGGIGSGKSVACRLLVSDLDCLAHIDADTVAHHVYRPGSVVLDQIAQEFGSHLLIPVVEDASGDAKPDPLISAAGTLPTSSSTMMLDRKKLGSIVFADPQAMTKLEQIVWPHVRTELQHRVDQCIQQQQQQQANNSNDEATFHKRNIIVIEAAVLLDAGWEDWMDGVWLVTASRETALQRLIEQRGLRREDAEQRINSQQQTRRIAEQHVPSLIQQRIMTAVIDNNGSLEDLKRNLEQALESATSWKLSSADTT